jgi:hypothetical protein
MIRISRRAGIDHFKAALEALERGKLTGPGSAADHLRDAGRLSPFNEEAQAALAAIRRGDVSAAKLHTKAGLKTAKTD